MSTVTAVLSMLHQAPGRTNSATRLFRHEPVLAWTLRRLSFAKGVQHRAILCWENQLEAVKPIAAAQDCFILSKGPRCELAMVDAVTVALKWADGWRGGLMGASCFDRGFYGPWVEEIRQQLQSEAILLIDPDAGLVDPALIDGLIAHAEQHDPIEFCFSQAAPGLSGALIRADLLQRLALRNTYLGRVLNYWPGVPGRDPVVLDECAPVPAPVARTSCRFLLDSDRQVARLEQSTISLNGQLMRTESQALVSAASERSWADSLPRDVVLELNTRRATNPVYWPGRYHPISRPDFSLEMARKLFGDLAALDDIRLTLAGVGDPLLSPQVFEIVAAAREAGIDTIHLETDLVGIDAAAIRRLVESPVDIVSVHVPALGPLTYQDVMGCDLLGTVVENMRQFVSIRQEVGRAMPMLVPTFVKCRANLQEMEDWYDRWLRAAVAAVLVGPSDYAGQIPDPAAADMSPPRRCPCRRLGSRLTVLSDGQVVSCEQDFLARQALGQIGARSLREIHQASLAGLRQDHRAGKWDAYPLCQSCREWHRP